MNVLYAIWLILTVPAFAFCAQQAMKWAYEDLDEVTNNDKLGLYIISALLAFGWPLMLAGIIGVGAHNYINRSHE